MSRTAMLLTLPFAVLLYHFMLPCCYAANIESEDDQEIPQSTPTDQSMTP